MGSIELGTGHHPVLTHLPVYTDMSRYPSAYGHTPSYRSAVYPSALGREREPVGLSSGLRSTLSDIDREFSSFSSSTGLGLGTRSALSDLDREFSHLPSVGSSLLTTPTHSQSSSSYKAENYSSTTSQVNGGRPHTESHRDSTYKSTRIGDSGIPHTSYSHSSSNYNSDRPYANMVSSHSYNI